MAGLPALSSPASIARAMRGKGTQSRQERKTPAPAPGFFICHPGQRARGRRSATQEPTSYGKGRRKPALFVWSRARKHGATRPPNLFFQSKRPGEVRGDSVRTGLFHLRNMGGTWKDLPFKPNSRHLGDQLKNRLIYNIKRFERVSLSTRHNIIFHNLDSRRRNGL
jgi:hypothetical protein